MLVDRQSVGVQHHTLGFGLSLQAGRIVRDGQVRVAGRIPLIVIDSVQDPDEVRSAVAQDSVKAEPEFRRLDFPGVCRADGRDGAAEHDAALEIADTAPVFERVNVHQLPP